jgi:TRAP-type C4-dicarboxylate transport system permease large subunit
MVGGVMLLVMLILLAAGVPVVFSIGLAAVGGILVIGPGAPWIMIPNSMFNGMDSFPLMAVPFFVLAGEFMNRGGITLRLVRFAGAIVGRIRGGLAHANIVSSMLFAGITGSALADTAAIGSILIPASITMVILGVTAGVSIGGLFLAGVLPGILIGFGLMGVAYFISRRRGYGVRTERITGREFLTRLKEALLALLMPVIILGGIFGGIMTPTESAAVAVFYALLVGMFVFRELKVRDLGGGLRSGLVTAFIMLIVGVARIFSDLLASEQIPQQLSQSLLSLTQSPWLILLLINVFLLFVGAVMDTSAAIIILVPILFPVAVSIGVDSLTFGIIMSINLIIGLATPPLGVCLFVAAGIAKISVERLVLAIWPFLLVEIGVLILITYVPGLAMAVPRFFGSCPVHRAR